MAPPPQPVFTSTNQLSKIVIERAPVEDVVLNGTPPPSADKKQKSVNDVECADNDMMAIIKVMHRLRCQFIGRQSQ